MLDTPQFKTVDSNNLDHYRAQPGNWDVQVSQLSRGAFQSHIRSLTLPGITVYDNRWGAASQVQGQSPDGWLMLGGVVDPERAGFHWCGQRPDRGKFACAGEGKEIEFTMENQASDVVLLIRPELLRKTAGSGAGELVRQRQHVNFGVSAGGQLLDVARDLLNSCESQSPLLEHEAITNRIQSTLLRALEDCFSKVIPDTTDSPNIREQAVHAAIQHVSKSPQNTSAWNMSQAAGVSQKTLEIAFKQILGITPGRYLLLRRLNAAHHALAHGRAGELSVTRVALGLGFTHPGRFSAAYRRLFDEMPSRTLEGPIPFA